MYYGSGTVDRIASGQPEDAAAEDTFRKFLSLSLWATYLKWPFLTLIL